MKNLNQNHSLQDIQPFSWAKKALILGQFFLIIFVYHILKDLKDSLVITSSDAGAEVLPFIKIWVILPFAVLASYLFSKIYQRYGRDKTFYIFVTILLTSYILFAFCLFPFRQEIALDQLSQKLKMILPIGFKGFISMISNWIYSFFYLGAELWSIMILSVLFWGFLNEKTTVEQAKVFYPLCVLTGNCAGILSGQTSRFLCQNLTIYLTWEKTMQIMILIVVACGLAMMVINRRLSSSIFQSRLEKTQTAPSSSLNFKESLLCIFQSRPLLCIATLVVGFGLTSNLIEVIWKESIKTVYPLPQEYNAYVNQLTSIIGILAVIVSMITRRMFKIFSLSQMALITPISLFFTSLIFFTSFVIPENYLGLICSCLSMPPMYLIMTLGSIYYVFAYTAKYTIFDMCKEMAFLSIQPEERMRAKSVIDSVGSRLGKSGSACLYQVLLITLGSTAGHVPIIGITAVLVIGVSIFATKSLGKYMQKEQKYDMKTAVVS